MDKASLRKKLFDLLPLDEDSLDQAIDYSLTLGSNDEIANHFISLIGESPLLFDFVQDLTSYRASSNNHDNSNKASGSSSNTPYTMYKKPEPKNKKADVKTKHEKKVVENPWHKQKQQGQQQQSNNKPGSNSNKQRLSNARGSTTTSELLTQKPSTKAKLKAEEHQAEQASRQKTRTKAQKLNDINDLDNLLKTIEYGGANSQVKCDCMAARHGLNKAIPNCLNCGKIICVKESGRTTCSFCNEPLISLSEKLEMIRLLQMEKEALLNDTKSKAAAAAAAAESTANRRKKKEKITISMGAGSKSFFKQQEKLFDNLEKKEKRQRELQEKVDLDKLNTDLSKAEANLNNLLGYQDNSAQRTKIIDQVSDYSLPDETNIWTKSSLDKILQLKKQQRNLKKKEKAEAERSGRGEKFIELNVKGGKVIVRETARQSEKVYDSSNSANNSDEDDDEALDSEDEAMKKEIKDLQDKIKKEEKTKQDELAKKNWDFNQDYAKWQDRKPRYVGNAGKSLPEDSDTETDNGTTENGIGGKLKGKFTRIQNSVNPDEVPVEELLLDL